MMFSIEPKSTTRSSWVPDRCRCGRTTAVLARLRELAPYAAIELVLPGGSLMALLLWLYRRYKKQPVLSQFSVCLPTGRRSTDPA
jgi:hypothetical protein